ncbi:siderophore-interacting protein [Cypionkella aquatica]|uniref:Siderophore-interacting protein n=1 Tax=Cypionkella aquatica TaxID=1756042 RepID=A0AA37U1S0_9RHOB|nr:siderophore-interacting protein [Cypionkella aquatica]GLS85959.1 siderophore-interacting protein [Cypionkella aquatica]
MIRVDDLALTGRIHDAPGAFAAHVAELYAAFDTASLPCGGLRINFDSGSITLQVAERGLAIAITAISASDLFVLREAVAGLVDGFDATLTPRLIWDRALPKLTTPPNFRQGRIVAISTPGAGYIRLRIAADHLAPFAVSGLHLRLLLPPQGRSPVWPSVSDTGRTVWPSGADKLHDPVYTIRAIDPAAGWLELDIFVHGHGRTCAWALAVKRGAEVGLIGPGGGYLPMARHLVLLGDETALPAIARILENAAPDTLGQALILLPDARAVQAIAAPPGVQIRWLSRASGDTLDTALATTTLPRAGLAGGRLLWIAAERAFCQRLRAQFTPATGWAKSETMIAAYWTAADVQA